MVENKKIGAYIAAKRKDLGLTQRALAEKLFVTNKAVSKWETGEGLPDIVSLNDLAKILNVSIENILEATDNLPHKSNLKKELQDYVELKLSTNNPTSTPDTPIVKEVTPNKTKASVVDEPTENKPTSNKINFSYILYFAVGIVLSLVLLFGLSWNVLSINNLALSMTNAFLIYGFYFFKLTTFLFVCFEVLFIIAFVILHFAKRTNNTLAKLTKLLTHILLGISVLLFGVNLFAFEYYFTISAIYYITTIFLWGLLIATYWLHEKNWQKNKERKI